MRADVDDVQGSMASGKATLPTSRWGYYNDREDLTAWHRDPLWSRAALSPNGLALKEAVAEVRAAGITRTTLMSSSDDIFAHEVDLLMKTIQEKSRSTQSQTSSSAEQNSTLVGASSTHAPGQVYASGNAGGFISLETQNGSGRADHSRKRYICSIENCTKSFYQKTHLEIHKRAHSGVKPYPCKEPGCGRRFSQLGNLRAHKIIHDLPKTHLCRLDDCGKRFTQIEDLKSHQNKFHMASIYSLLAKFVSHKNGRNMQAADKELWEIHFGSLDEESEGIKGHNLDSSATGVMDMHQQIAVHSVTQGEYGEMAANAWRRRWRQGDPCPTGSNVPKLENTRKVLRIRINNTEHLACPDSGSEKNIMSEAFAKKHNLRIRQRPKDLKRFQLGNGKDVWSMGRVRVPVELLGNTLGRKKRWFYVFPSCPVPLILGMSFLKEAEILSKNRYMLESCPDELGSISSLLWIGSPRHQMKCSLDGHQLHAIADTGSDLNLMSLKCAKREGFHIDRRREARRRVQVGDGTETETIGQVYVYNLSLDWRKAETLSSKDLTTTASPIINNDPTPPTEQTSLPLEEAPSTFGATFHVLPGLPCDVIFGRDLLDQTDAFNLCLDLLSTPPVDKETPFELKVFISLGRLSSIIPISRRKRRPAATKPDPKEAHDDARHAEIFRRSKREGEIALLAGSQQTRANVAERKRIKDWNVSHQMCVYCNPV